MGIRFHWGYSFSLVGDRFGWWGFILVGGHSLSLVGIHFAGGGSFLLVCICFRGIHSGGVALVAVGVVWWCTVGGWVGPHGRLWCSWVVAVVHHGCSFMVIGCRLLLNSCHIAIGNVAPASQVKRRRWGRGVMGLACMQ